MTGQWHQQVITHLLIGDNQPYFLRAKCTNARNNEVMNNDIFAWREDPDDPFNNPRSCKSSDDVEKATNVVVGDDLAIEDAGSIATVTWTTGSSTGFEDSQDVAVRFEYNIIDCDNQQRCFDLAELTASLPSTTVQGIALQNASLSVYQVDSQPVLSSSGGYSYAPGTVHAILSGVANGVPLVLVGANTGSAQGQILPASDVLTLSNLRFDYGDSVISGALNLSIVGDYTKRGPTAVIVPVDVPRACSDPVSFRAASSDLDGQSLTHVWWIPSTLVSTGPTLDVVLANGDYTIGLISRDPDGRLDAEAIEYTRTCL